MPVSSGRRVLLPLWLWLAFATAVPLLVVPADPMSMLLFLEPGLLCFLAGLAFVSQQSLAVRLSSALLIFAAASGVAAATPLTIVEGALAGYGLISMLFGAWAAQVLLERHRQIPWHFVAGYAIGSLAGSIGTIAGAVLLVRKARRNTEFHSGRR